MGNTKATSKTGWIKLKPPEEKAEASAITSLNANEFIVVTKNEGLWIFNHKTANWKKFYEMSTNWFCSKQKGLGHKATYGDV